jgi:hypothetical protein
LRVFAFWCNKKEIYKSTWWIKLTIVEDFETQISSSPQHFKKATKQNEI